MKTKILVLAAFVLTFAVGVLTGALVVRDNSRPASPWARRERIPDLHGPLQVEMLQSRLNLSEKQRAQVAEIISTHHERLRNHFSQIRPQSHQIIKEMTAQIDSVLTPEQRLKFHEAFPFPPPFWKKQHRPRRPPVDSLEKKF